MADDAETIHFETVSFAQMISLQPSRGSGCITHRCCACSQAQTTKREEAYRIAQTRKRVGELAVRPLTSEAALKKSPERPAEASSSSSSSSSTGGGGGGGASADDAALKAKAGRKRAVMENPDQIYEIERIVDVRWAANGNTRE